MSSHDEALARAMREEHERMASEPPLFTKEQLGGGGGGAASSSLDMATLLALIAFVGVVVFCAAQALWNPRRTFCAEQNGAREPPASVATTKPVARRRTAKAD